MSILDKKIIEHLADLSRIKLDKEKEEKILDDLKNILKHFDNLKKVDTDNIRPMTGGTFVKNVVREDEFDNRKVSKEKLKDSFPEKKDDFLKIPPVFSAEGGSASGGE